MPNGFRGVRTEKNAEIMKNLQFRAVKISSTGPNKTGMPFLFRA